MKLIDVEPIIKSLLGMQTILGYDSITIDGIVKALDDAKEIKFHICDEEKSIPTFFIKDCKASLSALVKKSANLFPNSKDSLSQEFTSLYNEGWNDACNYIDNLILSLPEKCGEWLPVDEKEDAFDCSECSAMVRFPTAFCPKCGTRMKENDTNDK